MTRDQKLIVAYAIKTEIEEILELTDDVNLINCVTRLDAYVDMLIEP